MRLVVTDSEGMRRLCSLSMEHGLHRCVSMCVVVLCQIRQRCGFVRICVRVLFVSYVTSECRTYPAHPFPGKTRTCQFTWGISTRVYPYPRYFAIIGVQNSQKCWVRVFFSCRTHRSFGYIFFL